MAKEALKYQLYQWRGLDKQGHQKRGLLPAEDLAAAHYQLKAQGIHVTHVNVKSEFLSFKKVLKKVTPQEVMLFARQMSTMVSAGMPLAQALEAIAPGFANLQMRAIVMSIHRDVTSGVSFTAALQKHPKVFSQLMTSLIYAGEQSGTLPVTLKQMASYLERMASLKKRVKKAMLYPIVVLGVTLGIAVLLLMMVVPQFASMYQGFGKKLPAATELVMRLSQYLIQHAGTYSVILAVMIIGFFVMKKKSPRVSYWADQMVLHIAIIGQLYQQAIIARVMRTLSITVSAGLTLVDALGCGADVSGNQVYANALQKVKAEIVSGQKFHTALTQTHLFPHVALQLVSVGEKVGSLEEMLGKIADYYDDEVTALVDNLSTLIEPVMLIVLGLVVGGFVLTMYLPIFQLGTVF